MWKKSNETTWTCDACASHAQSGSKETTTKSDSIPKSSQTDVLPSRTTRQTRNRLSIGPGVGIVQHEDHSPDEIQASTHTLQNLDAQVSLNDIMKKLIQMETQYHVLLTKYEEQIKITSKLQSEIDDLRRKQSDGNDGGAPGATTNEVVRESFQELSERQRRQNNIMIFGVLEDAPSEGQTRHQLDTVTATDIILKAYSDAKVENIKVFRVGRENHLKARPIKVILESSVDVKAVIRRAKEVRKIDFYKNISLGYDRTPKQIEEYKQLRTTMDSRLLNGETNLKIKYYNGFPKIIKMKGNLNF